MPAAKKPQDHKKLATVVFDLDAESPDVKPFPFKAGGKTYELPGEIPFGFAMKAAELNEAGLDAETAGTQLLPHFLELCPPEVRDYLNKSGGKKVGVLFGAWAEAVRLGESSPS